MKLCRLAIFVSIVVGTLRVPSPAQQRHAERAYYNVNGHEFTLPAGFTIELAAGPPVVERPIAIDFDDEGRLYVTESSGSNEKVEVQLQKKPHRVLRLESTKGDGKFDKRTVFADKMMLPEGVMYFKGSVYVAAPPSIWKLTDTDGDGVADQRVEWFQGKTLTGCANDLHGPYLGPDGWIYWGKGAFAKQTYEMPGKAPFVTRAAHIFRARPDGSGVEPVMTGGMDNPVDVVFTAGGERVFDTTFLQYPGGGKRDGLLHAVYGGIYGKLHHDVIDPHIWTGPNVMPVLTHLGAAAPSGLHRYESNAFGQEFVDNLFCCCFNMRKVTRHVLEPDGSTFKTRDSDFLISDNVDFHPTDVIEDADGSVLVVDTGGWYKLCCPTSQLVKPAALGAIYRIRKLGAVKEIDPRGLTLNWAKMTPRELTALLSRQPVVRKRAVQALADIGTPALPALAEVVEHEPNAVWAATRIEAPAARAVVRIALKAKSPIVRQVAVHSISAWRDREALPVLLGLVKNDTLPIRRVAAEAMGRLGDETAVPALLDALAGQCDRVLEHSLTYALIEIGDAKETAPGLKSSNAAVRRAALIALDNMPRGGLTAEAVAAELASPDSRLQEAAWWIAGRHPEWGAIVAGFLRDRLNAKTLPAAEQDELASQLAKFARGDPVQKLLAEQLMDANHTPEARKTVLLAMAQANVKQPPDIWIPPLTRILAGEDLDAVQQAIAVARAWRDAKQRSAPLAAALLATGDNPKRAASIRLTALAAVPGGLTNVNQSQIELLLAHLSAEEPMPLRNAAAEVLGRAKLSKEQLRSVMSSFKTIGPMELDRVLGAFAGVSDDAMGQELIAALQAAPAKVKAGLRAEMLKPRLAKFGPAVRQRAEELYKELNADAGQQQARLEQLLKTLPAGDRDRGHVVFNSAKAACFGCHAIGYRGGTVGPDLTHIARTRTQRDLLEAVVFPSASFVRGYEPVQITTKDGKTHNGVLRRDLPEEIALATGIDQETRIAREEIEDIQPSRVSLMPAGYDQVLTNGELADLLEFLKACK